MRVCGLLLGRASIWRRLSAEGPRRLAVDRGASIVERAGTAYGIRGAVIAAGAPRARCDPTRSFARAARKTRATDADGQARRNGAVAASTHSKLARVLTP